MLDKKFRTALSSYTLAIGRFFGRVFTPNQMSLFSLFFGVSSAFFIYSGNLWYAICLLIISALADWIDGAIAKATNKVTKFGGVLDSVIDKFIELAVYLSLAISNPMFVLPSMSAATMMMWSSYANQRCKRAGLEKGRGFLQKKERVFLLLVALFSLAISPTGTLQLCEGGCSFSVLKFAAGVLWLIAIFSFLTGVQRIYLTFKRVGKR